MPSRTSRASASAPRSPVNSTRTPRTVTRTTIERSLGAAAPSPAPGPAPAPRPARPDGAPVPRHEHGPLAPARRPAGRARPTRSSAGDSVAVATTPTSRPASAPARPPAWSASRCDSSTSGSVVDAEPVRQRSTARRRARCRRARRSRAGRQHERVALADVAGDDDGVRQRPAPDRLADRPAQDDQPTTAASASGRSRGTRQSAQPPATSSSGRAVPRPSAPAGQPVAASGTAAARVGHQHQPAHRPAGEPDERVGGRRRERADHRGEQAQHGRRGHGRGGEQVGGQRDQADRAGQAGDERRGRQAGRRTDRHRVGEDRAASRRSRSRRDQPGASRTMAAVAATDSAKPASRASPGSCEQQHARRRRRAPGRPHAAGPRPARRRVTAPIAAARTTLALGPGQHDEPGERQPGDDGLHPPVDRPAPQRPEHAGQHDGDVGAGHRGEMRQPGPPEVRRRAAGPWPGCRRRPAPGSSPAGRASSTRAADAGQPVPQRPRGALQPRRRPRPARAAPGRRRPRPRRRPARGSDAPTRIVTASPGQQRPPTPAPAANSSTGASSRYVRRPSTSLVTCASAMNRGAPGPASRCGSPSRSRTTVTARPDSASARSGEASRAAPRTAAMTAGDRERRQDAQEHASRCAGTPPASARAADGERRGRRGAHPEPERGQIRAPPAGPTQTVAATGTSRRSTQVHRDRRPGRGRRGDGHTVTSFGEFGRARRADAGHVVQLVDAGERSLRRGGRRSAGPGPARPRAARRAPRRSRCSGSACRRRRRPRPPSARRPAAAPGSAHRRSAAPSVTTAARLTDAGSAPGSQPAGGLDGGGDARARRAA